MLELIRWARGAFIAYWAFWDKKLTSGFWCNHFQSVSEQRTWLATLTAEWLLRSRRRKLTQTWLNENRDGILGGKKPCQEVSVGINEEKNYGSLSGFYLCPPKLTAEPPSHAHDRICPKGGLWLDRIYCDISRDTSLMFTEGLIDWRNANMLETSENSSRRLTVISITPHAWPTTLNVQMWTSHHENVQYSITSSTYFLEALPCMGLSSSVKERIKLKQQSVEWPAGVQLRLRTSGTLNVTH